MEQFTFHNHSTPGYTKVLEKTIGCTVVILLTVFAYNRMMHLSFSGPDDSWMLLKNELVHPDKFSLEYLYTIFTSFNSIQYSPVNTFYYYLIYQINGYDPYYYHTFSFFFHLLNIFLIYLLAKEVLRAFNTPGGGKAAYLICLIWAIHPLNVEVVVWISASKIVLSGFFILSSFLLFIKAFLYQKSLYYLFSVILFLLACFCKEQSIVMPAMCMLFLICYKFTYQKKQFANKKIYLYLCSVLTISAVFLVISIKANGLGTPDITPIAKYPLYQRIILSFYCVSFYITNQVLPLNLHFHHPFPVRPHEQMPLAYYLYPATLLVFIIFLALTSKHAKHTFFYVLCIGIFLINIVLVLQIIPMARPAILAERYMYLPSIGLLLMLLPISLNNCYVVIHKKGCKVLLQMALVIYVLYLAIYSNVLVHNWEELNVIR